MKSNSVFKRVLSILLCLLMIVPICSGLAIGGSAEDPTVRVEENDFYRVEYENGVFHVILAADKLNEVVKKGDITKDDLISMIPDEIYSILQERTLASVIAALQTMAEEKKVTGNMVFDIVPVEVMKEIVEEYALLDLVLETPEFTEWIKELMEAVDKDELRDLIGDETLSEMINPDNTLNMAAFRNYYAGATSQIRSEIVALIFEVLTIEDMGEFIGSADKTMIKEKWMPIINRFITEQIPYINLNDVEIYTGENYTVPSTQMFKLHPAAIEKVLLGLVPSASAFADLASGEVFLSLMFDTVLYGENVGFGFDVCFEGNMSKINDGSDKIAEYLTYALNEEGTFVVDAVSPEAAASLYRELLASEEVDESFKVKILNFYTTSGAEYDALLESITLEEIRTALQAIDESGNKYIDRAIEYTLKALNKFEDKFEGGKAKLSDLLSKIPADLKAHTLVDYYSGNSVFRFNYTTSVSTLEWIDEVARKYGSVAEYIDQIKMFIDSEQIVQNFDVTATTTGVFKATFKDLKGNVLYTTFLPADVQISTVVALVSELSTVEVPFGWAYEGGTNDGEAALLMIREDATLVVAEKPSYGYTVEHWVEGLDGIYTIQMTESGSVTAGETATATEKTFEGFTFDATIAGTIKEAIVEEDGSTTLKLFYTRNSYILTWNLEGGTATGAYTQGRVKFGAPITAPTAVEKDGYTFTGWDKAVPTTMPAEDVTLTAQYDVKSGDNTVAIGFFSAVTLACCAITVVAMKKRED